MKLWLLLAKKRELVPMPMYTSQFTASLGWQIKFISKATTRIALRKATATCSVSRPCVWDRSLRYGKRKATVVLVNLLLSTALENFSVAHWSDESIVWLSSVWQFLWQKNHPNFEASLNFMKRHRCISWINCNAYSLIYSLIESLIPEFFMLKVD